MFTLLPGSFRCSLFYRIHFVVHSFFPFSLLSLPLSLSLSLSSQTLCPFTLIKLQIKMKLSSVFLSSIALLGSSVVSCFDHNVGFDRGNIIRIMSDDKCLTVPDNSVIFPTLSFEECSKNLFDKGQLFSYFKSGAIISQSNSQQLTSRSIKLFSRKHLVSTIVPFRSIRKEIDRNMHWNFYGETLDSVMIRSHNGDVMMQNLTVAVGSKVSGDRFKIVDVVAVAAKEQ